MSGIPAKHMYILYQTSLVVKVFSPFGECLVEASIAAMTAMRLFGWISTRFAQ